MVASLVSSLSEYLPLRVAERLLNCSFEDAVKTAWEWRDKYKVEISSGYIKLNGKTFRQGKGGGGKKGRTVKNFSRGSRIRLIERLFSLDFERLKGSGYRIYFNTNTYPVEISLLPRVAKKHLKLFLEDLKKWDPEGFLFWKIEFTKRGVVHFHYLYFTKKEWRQVRDFFKYRFVETFLFIEPHLPPHLISKWVKATENVQLVESLKRVRAYVSKYVAKVVDKEVETGRYWGIWNRAVYKEFVKKEEIEVDYLTFVELRRRLLGRYKRLKVLSKHERIYRFVGGGLYLTFDKKVKRYIKTLERDALNKVALQVFKSRLWAYRRFLKFVNEKWEHTIARHFWDWVNLFYPELSIEFIEPDLESVEKNFYILEEFFGYLRRILPK